MIRRFVIEHIYIAYILSFILLVLIPIFIYKIARADTSQALKSDRSAICVEKNPGVYETTYYGNDGYTHTRYYDTTYREPLEPRYYNYDYYGSARPHGPAAWDTSESYAWGSGSYNYYGTGPSPYPGSARPHGPSAW